MFSIIPALSIVLAATSASAGLVSPHHRALAHQARATQPASYAAGYLEDYQTYHARYLAIDCEAKHNTTYFDKCCHPMLATENLKDDRAPDCAPSSSALASASAAFATSTISPGSDGDDDDCDDEPEEASSTPAPTSSKKNTAAKETAAASSSSSSKKADPTTSSKKAEASSSSSSKKAAAATTSSSSAKAAATASSSSGGGLAGLVAKIFSGGQATFFTQNGVAGACGQVHPDSAIIAALQTSQYANGAHCGKFIQVVNKKNNKSQKVQVADECPTCDGTTSVDFSKGAFDALGGTVEEGVFEIEWGFLDN